MRSFDGANIHDIAGETGNAIVMTEEGGGA
jgi:hypothetical protein